MLLLLLHSVLGLALGDGRKAAATNGGDALVQGSVEVEVFSPQWPSRHEESVPGPVLNRRFKGTLRTPCMPRQNTDAMPVARLRANKRRGEGGKEGRRHPTLGLGVAELLLTRLFSLEAIVEFFFLFFFSLSLFFFFLFCSRFLGRSPPSGIPHLARVQLEPVQNPAVI